MKCVEFLRRHGALPEQICAGESLGALLLAMEQGLAGQGEIPMLLSYLPAQIQPEPMSRCAVLDAGGTNLRTALAVFDENGRCRLEQLQTCAMPGTEGELGCGEFYDAIASRVKPLQDYEKVGFCFSYNVTLNRDLDGCLDFWCKEVRVPEAVGQPVGSSLRKALGAKCRSVHVLNDSVAAMLGAGTAEDPVQVGVILGTGINVCYEEVCTGIPKLQETLRADRMIISTEIGEFRGISRSDFEEQVIASSDAPHSAFAEKQCSGAYLGKVIAAAWQQAAREGLLPAEFADMAVSPAQISRYLAGERDTGIPDSAEAASMARLLIHRGAKVAAILCAGPILQCARTGKPVNVAMEGSQYWKLTGFADAFRQELTALLAAEGREYRIVKSDNACLRGAALAAFAKPM